MNFIGTIESWQNTLFFWEKIIYKTVKNTQIWGQEIVVIIYPRGILFSHSLVFFL